jgi:hypothetical protein
MNKKISAERAIRSAFASARMEGLNVTPEVERNVRLIVSGKVTVEERVRQLKAKGSKTAVGR